MAYLSRCLPVYVLSDRPALVVRRKDGTEKVIADQFQSSCALGTLQWFPDGRSLLVRNRRSLLAIDVDTGQTRDAFPEAPSKGPCRC
jgi:hypothetical protein